LQGFYSYFKLRVVDCLHPPPKYNDDATDKEKKEYSDLYISYRNCKDFIGNYTLINYDHMLKYMPPDLDPKDILNKTLTYKNIQTVMMVGYRSFDCNSDAFSKFICNLYPEYP